MSIRGEQIAEYRDEERGKSQELYLVPLEILSTRSFMAIVVEGPLPGTSGPKDVYQVSFDDLEPGGQFEELGELYRQYKARL